VIVYLAGPMTGIPDLNFPAFHNYAHRIRAAGHTVINPAETDHGDTDKPWDYYLRKDIPHILTCDAVAVMPGWRNSRGAQLETTIADALHIPILDADTLQPVTETVLQEADRLVYGDREEKYGHPGDDYGRTAKLWSAILGHDVTAKQAALCMVAVKLSREVNAPQRDNLVDGAGYFAVAARIQARADGTE